MVFNGYGGGSGGGGLYSSIITMPGTVFVSSAGDNATAVRNRLDKPCLDIAAAKTLAQSGDNIVIMSDLTNQAILNDSAKNLNYYFIGARSISFTGNVVNITTAVTLKVFGENCSFTGANIINIHDSATLVFNFDTWVQSGYLQLEDGTSNIKGRIATKTNTGFPFIFGYSDNQTIVEIETWTSTSTSISYFSDATNTTLKNSNLTFTGQIRVNQSSTVSVSNNVLIDNCNISISFFELGLNNNNSFRGTITFNKTKITSTSASKTTIQVAHAYATGSPTLVFNQGCVLIPNAALSYCISNPAANPVAVKLQGTLAAQKPINTTNITLPITGGAVLDDTDIQ